MKQPGWVRIAVIGAALSGLATAAVWSVRIAWADYLIRQETVNETEAAIALAPDHAEPHARLAWLLSDVDPKRANDALRRAVALNPQDARSWIELGLRAEADGDYALSIQCLMRAAEVDRMYLPRWTLANYYFRRDDAAKFWFWAKEAAAMVYGDAQPLFQLCGRMAEDGNLMDRLEIEDPDVCAGYLAYLLMHNRADLAVPSVRQLLRDNRRGDLPLLLTACERLLETSRVSEAAEIWNRLAQYGSLPFKAPAGEGLQLVANGTFAVSPTSRGFDWRVPNVEGVSVSREEELQGLRVTFSGREPEDCEALLQLVPVREKVQYELRFVYRTHGIGSGQGLAWVITDATSAKVLNEGSGLESETDADENGKLSFESPAECRLIRLALKYHRTPGTTRLEGFLTLRSVALRPAPQSLMDGSRVKK